MTEALKRIQLIFQTEVKILKYPYPGLSYFSLKTARPLMESCTRNPNCLVGLEPLDSLRICRLPLQSNNNLRLVYLSVLIMAFEEANPRLLRRVKSIAYDQSYPLTSFIRESIPEEFRQHYEDRLLRKLFVQFFHLVGSRKSPNRVIKFIELHPILDLGFLLLFKRLVIDKNPVGCAYNEKLNTGEIIQAIFKKIELTPNIIERRLRISQYRYLAQDQEFTYMTYHWKDDIDMDFPETISDSDSDEETQTNARTESTTKFSMRDSQCQSSKTKMSGDDGPNRWSTPNKGQAGALFQSTMIPTRENIQRPFFKSPSVVETHTEKGSVKSNLCIDEVQMKCGQIKNRLKKLESDVEIYNNPPKSRNDNITSITRAFPPLVFKQKHSERKQSNECDTSFFTKQRLAQVNGNGITTSINGTCSAATSLSKLVNTPARLSQYSSPQTFRPSFIQVQANKSTREISFVKSDLQSSSLQRIGSIVERPSESKRVLVNESSQRISSNSSLLLQSNPKKINVRKI